jgi:hypothetical protein
MNSFEKWAHRAPRSLGNPEILPEILAIGDQVIVAWRCGPQGSQDPADLIENSFLLNRFLSDPATKFERYGDSLPFHFSRAGVEAWKALAPSSIREIIADYGSLAIGVREGHLFPMKDVDRSFQWLLELS